MARNIDGKVCEVEVSQPYMLDIIIYMSYEYSQSFPKSGKPSRVGIWSIRGIGQKSVPVIPCFVLLTVT